MKTSPSAFVFTFMILVFASVYANDAPFDEAWAPSPWGAEDTVGAANRLTPDIVLKHAALIKTGKYTTLGKVYSPDMPFFGSRGFKMTIPGLPTGGPFGEHQIVYNDELITTELGQVGTQFDGPGHIGIRTSKGHFYYNGVMLEDEANAYGLGRLGVEHVAQKGYVCRGVLLDATTLHGVDMLPIPKTNEKTDIGIVSDDDIDAMIEKQGIAPITEGDCVFLYTGWGNLWHPRDWDSFDDEEKQKRIAQFNSGEPGFSASACSYLAERKIALTGADTWGTDALPGEDANLPFVCHAQLQTRHGIWNLENLDFTDLINDKVYEFLFVWAPLKLKGATGSPGNPIAIY